MNSVVPLQARSRFCSGDKTASEARDMPTRQQRAGQLFFNMLGPGNRLMKGPMVHTLDQTHGRKIVLAAPRQCQHSVAVRDRK